MTQDEMKIRDRCAEICTDQADYYDAVAKRDDRPDMAQHALTCRELARLITARVN